jgi:undecaprenyl-diphosphatase
MGTLAMELWQWIQGYDQQLFRFIFFDLAFEGGDKVFPFLTDIHKNQFFAYSFLIAMIIGLWQYFGARSLGIWVYIILTLALTDALCSQVIKPYVQRVRPNFEMSDVKEKAPVAGRFGFVSNHSANSFALATCLFFCFPMAKWSFLFYAAIIAYSRVYCGVHYPMDVIVGAIIGITIAKILGRLTHKLLFGKIRYAG